MNFNYGKTLSKPFEIIWKHKVLWVFGIFASFARGNGGNSGGNGSGGGESPFQTPGDPNMPYEGIQQGLGQFSQMLQDNWWIIAAIIIVLIIISMAFYALGMIGRVGLIKGTYQVEKGAASLAFGELWSESLPYFWRIFGLNFLIGLIVFLIVVPLVLIGVLTAGIGFACILPIICLMIPVGWAVAVILEQAQAAIVIEDLGIVDGWKRGWELSKKNFGPLIVMALILTIGGAIAGIIIALPLIIALIPLLIGATALEHSLRSVYITLACCVVYAPVLIALNGFLTAYIQSAWTMTYLEFVKPQEDAPIFVSPNA